MRNRSIGRRNRDRVVGSLAIAALLVGCGGEAVDDSPPESEPESEPETNDAASDAEETQEEQAETDGGESQVEIVDNGYEPADLDISVGDTVTWEHAGELPHTVTFDDGEDSGTIESGATFSRSFDEAGDFSYVCTIHPEMEGTLTVTE